MTKVEVFAPAKINLTLHVTDRRDDGYHVLDSLVVFADVGDDLTIETSDQRSTRISGPFAEGVPDGSDNLVWRAIDHVGGGDFAVELVKNLPHGAGIGGGSSDAGATLRAVAAIRDEDPPEPDMLAEIAADVPVCTLAETTRMRGIGEILTPVPELPDLWLVLANPGISIPTAEVFEALRFADHPPMTDPEWDSFSSFVNWLAYQRNDLQAAACAMVPEVTDVLTALNALPDCALARMSGSGATCWGIFPDETSAHEGAEVIGEFYPEWWVTSAGLV